MNNINTGRPSRKGFRNKSKLERIGEIVASIAGLSNEDIVDIYEQHELARDRRVQKSSDPVRRETLDKKLTGWTSWMRAGGMDPKDPGVQEFCRKLVDASDKPHQTFGP
jgi:hypothetical protein